jgi:hypothetical protein
MRALVDRLADIGWIESSAIMGGEFRVRFTSQGRAALRLLGELLHQTYYPASKEDSMCLSYLCDLARDEAPSSGGPA